MSNKFLFSLAMTGLLVATAEADTSSSIVTTEDWFTESVSAYATGNLPSGTKGQWTAPQSGGTASVAEAGKISIDTEPNDPLKFTPTTWSGIGVSEYSFVTKLENLVVHAAAPTLTSEPFGALIAVDDSGNVWKGRVNGSWQTLTGATPADGATYYAKIEVQPSSTDAKVRYSVSSDNSTFTTLQYNSTDWQDSGKDNASVSHLAYAGCATLGDIKGVVKSTVTVTIPTDTMSDATKEALATLVGQAVDSDAFESAIASDTKLGNGLTMLESVILGVPSTDASGKPFTAPVQVSESNKLGFTIGNVNPGKYGTDKTVKFEVVDVDTGVVVNDAVNDSTKVSAGGTATVTAPNTVKYYKIKITIE